MKKYFFFALLALLCTTQNVFAQENEQVSIDRVDLEDAVVVANVELDNVSFIEQIDRLVRISFDVVNEGETVQPDIRYSVQLAEQLPAPDVEGVMHNFTVSEKVYEDVISLNSGERVSRDIVYDVPAVFSGDYTIVLFVTTTDGVPLAIAEVENVNVDSGEGILVNNCAVLVEGDNTQYSVDAGVDIGVDENIYVQCDVKNLNNTDSRFRPQFLSYEGSIFGELLGQEILKAESLAVGEMRNMKWQIPKEKKPRAYDAALQLLSNDGIILSNIVPVHYVVQGESGTILNAQLDKDRYTTGDTANILFDIAGRADLFFGSRAHGEDLPDIEPQDAYYSVEIHDGNGNVCGSAVDQKMDFSVALVEGKVQIKNECIDPVVAVTLVNSDKKVLDEAEFVVKSESSETNTATAEKKKDVMQMIFYGVLFVTVVGIIAILLVTRKKRGGNGMASFIFVIVGGGLLFSHNVGAISFYVPPPAPWGALGYAMYVTASANPVCDATLTKITGTAKIKVCNNASINAYVYIDSTRVLHRYCPKERANCGTYSFSKWDGSRVGNNSVRVRADYKLRESRWDQSKTKTLYYTVPPCPPKESCGTSHRKTLTSRPTSGLCGDGALRWIDTVANDGTWNWKCGSLNCYANRSRTLTGVLTASANCLLHTGGSASVDLSVGSIGGTARGDIQYRYNCGSGWSGWTTSSTHVCSYSSIGNKTVRAQIGRDGVTANTNSPTINVSYCPADGACSSSTQIDVPATQTDVGWNSLPASYFCNIGAPIIRPAFPDYGNSVTWDCDGLYYGDPTTGSPCSAKREVPAAKCGTQHPDKLTNTTPPSGQYTLCDCDLNCTNTTPTLGADGKWHWDCDHNVVVANPKLVSCEAPTCITNDPINATSPIMLSEDMKSHISLDCPGSSNLCCIIHNANNPNAIDVTVCSNQTGEMMIVPGVNKLPAECWFEDGDGDGDGDPKGKECDGNETCINVSGLTVSTACMESQCTASGTCAKTPRGATDKSQCKSSCNSDADCSSGRMIETKP